MVGVCGQTGCASFIVNYQAIIFRPFKNQVMDAKVTNTHEVMPVTAAVRTRSAKLVAPVVPFVVPPVVPHVRRRAPFALPQYGFNANAGLTNFAIFVSNRVGIDSLLCVCFMICVCGVRRR